MAGTDDPGFYGHHWSEIYDGCYGDLETNPAVTFLSKMAGRGRVLELAIGTGRLAIPLADLGVQVEGLDSSAAMVEAMRAKQGGEAIPVVIGDMAQALVDGMFAVVFVAFNSFFCLTSQAQQVSCFRNVSRMLESGGLFVLECFVPDPTQFTSRLRALDVSEAKVSFQLHGHNRAEQRVISQTVTIDEHGVGIRPVIHRYASPAELDLMADLADMNLYARFGDWDGRPYTSHSVKHVSVYQLRSPIDHDLNCTGVED